MKGRMDKMKRSWLLLLRIVVAKRVKAQAKERRKKNTDFDVTKYGYC